MRRSWTRQSSGRVRARQKKGLAPGCSIFGGVGDSRLRNFAAKLAGGWSDGNVCYRSIRLTEKTRQLPPIWSVPLPTRGRAGLGGSLLPEVTKPLRRGWLWLQLHISEQHQRPGMVTPGRSHPPKGFPRNSGIIGSKLRSPCGPYEF